MKKIALFMLAISLFAASCKKDDDKTTVNGGSFSIDGQAYKSDYAYWNITDGLTIYNVGIAPDFIENSVQIFVDSLNTGKYDFLTRGNGAYDVKKNFSSAVVVYNKTNEAGKGTEITGVTGGTLNVTHTGNSYTFNYTIAVGGKTVTGSFTGEVHQNPSGE
jgi:hypothetical protein